MLNMEVLISSIDEIQLGLVKGILENNKIPFLEKTTGAGGYMKIYGGFSLYETMILVEDKYLEKASDLIANLLPDSEEEPCQE